MTNYLKNILKDKALTKEQKIKIINQYYDNYRKEIDKELNKYLTKQYAGAALEIGSAALPVGGVGKLGGTIGKQLLKKQLGRKVSENIGSGMLYGGASGGLFGLGESLKNETNPVLSTLQGALLGTTTGATLGAVGSNIQKIIKGQHLKNYGNIDNLNEILRKQYNNDSRKFYQDYIQEIQLNKNGNFDFSKRGVQEQLRWNPQQAQNFPELVNDIKNAKRLPDVPNKKPLEKPHVSHYEVYRGNNGDHYIEVLKDGSKRFYITKGIPDSTSHATSTASTGNPKTILNSPNNIIQPLRPDYNPTIGNFDFSKRGVQEQLRWNPQQAQNFPELVNDIKNAKRLPDVPNKKPLEKLDVSHYEVYRGKNGDHYIEVFNNGDKRYYVTKDTPQTATHTASTDDLRGIGTYLESPNNIIQPLRPDYNPTTGNFDLLYGNIEKNKENLTGFAAPISSSFLDNVLKDIEQNKNQNPQKQNIKKFINPVTGDNTIFTREKLSKMDSDEFTKNEQAIFAQLNTLGIPSQKEVNKAVYNNSSQDADGHWVTINGHHVLIKD